MIKDTEFKDFKDLISLIKFFDSEEKCTDYLAFSRWKNSPICPYCNHQKVYILKGENKRYKCSLCRKQFSARVGTIFQDSRVELSKWYAAIYLVTAHKKGISSLQLAADISVTQKTAWFMLQRIRKCFAFDDTDIFDNEVEIDESFVGGRNKNRHKDKKVENSQGRSFQDKTPVVGMIERGGKLAAKAIENTSGDTLTPEIVRVVKQTATVHTDEWLGYNSLQKIYDHAFVKHNQGEYVNGRIHTNTIEGFWSLLKRGIIGIYHFTSKKHLQKYLDEFVFRYNTRNSNNNSRFNDLLSNINGKLAYAQLIQKL